MLVAERKASIVDRVQQVEDEQVLKMIEAILNVHQSEAEGQDDNQTVVDSVGRSFNPLDYYTPRQIADFEAREDFIGYAADKSPLFGIEEAEKMDQAVADIASGKTKGISHVELKERLEKKMEAWRQRTK